MRSEEKNTWFFRLALDPFGEREMDLLTREGFSLVGFLEAISDEIGAYVRIRDVGHTRCSPKRHRSARRHLHTFFLFPTLTQHSFSPTLYPFFLNNTKCNKPIRHTMLYGLYLSPIKPSPAQPRPSFYFLPHFYFSFLLFYVLFRFILG